MAKRKELDEQEGAQYFEESKPRKDTKNEVEDPVKAHGIGLRQSEWDKLAEIAQALGWKSSKGWNRHKVAVYAIRYFLKHIETGELELQEPKHKTLPGL